MYSTSTTANEPWSSSVPTLTTRIDSLTMGKRIRSYTEHQKRAAWCKDPQLRVTSKIWSIRSGDSSSHPGFTIAQAVPRFVPQASELVQKLHDFDWLEEAKIMLSKDPWNGWLCTTIRPGLSLIPGVEDFEEDEVGLKFFECSILLCSPNSPSFIISFSVAFSTSPYSASLEAAFLLRSDSLARIYSAFSKLNYRVTSSDAKDYEFSMLWQPDDSQVFPFQLRKVQLDKMR